jgi:hypothetical protein
LSAKKYYKTHTDNKPGMLQQVIGFKKDHISDLENRKCHDKKRKKDQAVPVKIVNVTENETFRAPCQYKQYLQTGIKLLSSLK